LCPDQVADWPALREWNLGGKPNWGFFVDKFGSDEVSVAKCQMVEFGDQCRETMTVSELVSRWRRDPEAKQLYLKDWHLRLKHPTYEFYRTPEIFMDDWMNDYYINSRSGGGSPSEIDDFRFVYMGPEGTFTPLHHDVYCSYSWSTNVVGSKKWTLFPPAVTDCLYATNNGELSQERVFDVRSYNRERFPKFQQALDKAIVVIQKQGETIFVPSGWYHQVENLTDCISINHNWANGNSLLNMYSAMCAEVADVEEALSDVREMMEESWKPEGPEQSDGWQEEWVAVVQDVLKKNAGWGWFEFWSMVLHAVRTRWDPFRAVANSSGWNSAPQSLRPPWVKESTVVMEVLERFQAERQEAHRIPGLLIVIEDLKTFLNQHPSEETSSVRSPLN